MDVNGLGGGGVKAYVTNLPPGTYEVTYWYHITLRADHRSSAGASLNEGSRTVAAPAVHGSAPVATYDSKLQTRTVTVTVGPNGEALVFKYEPSATTPHHAGISDNATARAEFGIIQIRRVSTP